MLTAYPLQKCSWPFLLATVALLSGLVTLVITTLYESNLDVLEQETTMTAWCKVRLPFVLRKVGCLNTRCPGFTNWLGTMFNSSLLGDYLPTDDLAIEVSFSTLYGSNAGLILKYG